MRSNAFEFSKVNLAVKLLGRFASRVREHCPRAAGFDCEALRHHAGLEQSTRRARVHRRPNGHESPGLCAGLSSVNIREPVTRR